MGKRKSQARPMRKKPTLELESLKGPFLCLFCNRVKVTVEVKTQARVARLQCQSCGLTYHCNADDLTAATVYYYILAATTTSY